MDTERPALDPPPFSPPSQGWGSRVLAFLANLGKPAVLIATLALLLLGWQWYETQGRLADLQQELAKRLANSDTLAREGQALSKQNHEALQELHGKLGALDAKLAEAQSQQMALEAMYQELSRSRDERLFSEIEQTVTIAAQQLQLAGNVEAALIALQGADAHLARASQGGRPQLLSLRKLINRDIERLKALPLADVPGIALKLESVIAAADSLPLAFERRAKPEAQTKPQAPSSAVVTDSITGAPWWRELGRELWAELKQLIRVERIDQSDPALLSPSHAFFLRENLKLRLIDAKLALLQRDSWSFREDLRQSRISLERYFDTREKPVQTALSAIKSISSADLSLELPTLGETLAMLRNYKLAREKNVK